MVTTMNRDGRLVIVLAEWLRRYSILIQEDDLSFTSSSWIEDAEALLKVINKEMEKEYE